MRARGQRRKLEDSGFRVRMFGLRVWWVPSLGLARALWRPLVLRGRDRRLRRSSLLASPPLDDCRAETTGIVPRVMTT